MKGCFIGIYLDDGEESEVTYTLQDVSLLNIGDMIKYNRNNKLIKCFIMEIKINDDYDCDYIEMSLYSESKFIQWNREERLKKLLK